MLMNHDQGVEPVTMCLVCLRPALQHGCWFNCYPRSGWLNEYSLLYKIIYFWNGNESENPFLISNFTKNDDFLRKWQKTLFGQKFLWQANKNSFGLKIPKFLENHVKTHV